jgi:hypothetical protein
MTVYCSARKSNVSSITKAMVTEEKLLVGPPEGTDTMWDGMDDV